MVYCLITRISLFITRIYCIFIVFIIANWLPLSSVNIRVIQGGEIVNKNVFCGCKKVIQGGGGGGWVVRKFLLRFPHSQTGETRAPPWDSGGISVNQKYTSHVRMLFRQNLDCRLDQTMNPFIHCNGSSTRTMLASRTLALTFCIDLGLPEIFYSILYVFEYYNYW